MQKYKPIVTGVLTSESQWAEIMGSDYIDGSRYLLWYNNINEQSINKVLTITICTVGTLNMTTNQPLTILRLLVDGKNK